MYQYDVVFYEDKDGNSDLLDFIEGLRKTAGTNKDNRIQLRQISMCLELLAINGTRVGSDVTKHIKDDLWELRPGNNRIFYFYYKDNKFVLLSHFRKETRKTPTREIEKAMSRMNDYKKRMEF